MSRRSKATSSSSSSPSSPDTKENSNSQTALLTNPSGETGHLSTVRALNLADYITLLNGFSGTMSVLSSMRYCLNSVPPPSSPIGSAASAAAAAAAASDFSALWVALAFMPAGLLADFMDGKVARWRGKGEGSLLGQELDSLADLISFGLAPASAAFALGFRTPLDTLVLTFFVLCGLTRLARFNVTVANIPKDASGKSKYFEGLPIPTSLTMVAGMAVALRTGCVLDKLPLGVWAQGSLVEVHPLVGVFVLWGCFMLSRSLKVPKP